MRHYIPKMHEDYFDTYVPADPYGFSKYMIAKMAQNVSNIYNLRLFGVFGPYEEWNRRFISNMIYRALTGQPLKMGKHAYFDYLYTNDLLSILKWFIHNIPRYSEYNVCSGQPIDLYCLGKLVCNLLGRDENEIQCETGWKPEYSGDNTRLLDEMGEKFVLTPMETAIQELIAYYIQHSQKLWQLQHG